MAKTRKLGPMLLIAGIVGLAALLWSKRASAAGTEPTSSSQFVHSEDVIVQPTPSESAPIYTPSVPTEPTPVPTTPVAPTTFPKYPLNTVFSLTNQYDRDRADWGIGQW